MSSTVAAVWNMGVKKKVFIGCSTYRFSFLFVTFPFIKNLNTTTIFPGELVD